MKITITLQDQPDGTVFTEVKFNQGFDLKNPPKTPAVALLAAVFSAIQDEGYMHNAKVNHGDR